MRKYFQVVFDLGWFGSAYLLNMEIHELEKKSEQRAWGERRLATGRTRRKIIRGLTKHSELQFLKSFHFLLLEKDWGGGGVVKDNKVLPLYHLT